MRRNVPRTGSESVDEPASDSLTVATEPVDGDSDLERVSIGAVIDVLIAHFLEDSWGVGTATVCSRVRELATDEAIFEVRCGHNVGIADRVTASIRDDLDRMSRREFLDDYNLPLVPRVGGYRRAYLGIGSNLGDRLEYLQLAVDGLAAHDGVEVMAVSQVYETEPVGGPAQGQFLNAVVAVDTTLGAHALLDLAQSLEQEAHRVRGERWGPRTLDVDVLMLGDEEVHDPDLEIPHPRMAVRGFVLAPLHDFLPPGLLDAPAHDWPGVRLTDLSLRLP